MSQHPITDITFESFNLHPNVLSGLHAAGFTRCTPIQALTLPVALPGGDVAGQAQTGTGKTAAFLVAVMNRLLTQPAVTDRKLSDPRAIIIAPTRELAIQIDKDFRNIGRDSGLRSALIYGGVDYDKQRELLKGGCDLIIATPGRLIDYLKQHVFSLNAIEAVVIDEADRMFDLGFIKDIRFLFRRMPPREQRQSMLFSATLSHRVLELAYDHMNSPAKLTVETDTVTADRVRQLVYFPAKEEKLPLLINLLSRIEEPRGIVFVNTKVAAEKVTRMLERYSFSVATLSGDVPQAKRERLLAKFQKGEIELLVATDVAARGLHIAAVSHVFNFDLPHDAEDYVHRIGRTARLGAEGDAISFACDLYAMGLPDIEAFIEQKIPTASITAELLLAPPPRTRAAHSNVASDEEAADDLRNTAGAPPKAHSGPPRPGASRPRSGATGERSRPPRAPRREGVAASRPPRTSAPVAAVQSVVPAVAAVIASPPDATAGETVRKPRRRRGGRGRTRREEGETGAPAAANGRAANGAAANRVDTDGAASNATSARKSERKPHREHSSRDHSSTASVRAPVSKTPAPNKPGFFRRIAKLFAPR
ncbi:MAG: ATP-dependent RNA helicase RhlB [Dokdonella sp.]